MKTYKILLPDGRVEYVDGFSLSFDDKAGHSIIYGDGLNIIAIIPSTCLVYECNQNKPDLKDLLKR